MKPNKIVVDVAINTEGKAATNDQRMQALDEAVRLAAAGHLHPSEVTTYAGKFADFLAGNGAS